MMKCMYSSMCLLRWCRTGSLASLMALWLSHQSGVGCCCSSPSFPRNNKLLLFLQQKQNIEPQLMPVRKLYGLDISFQSLDSSSSSLLHFGVTIKVPSSLPKIQFYISVANTLRYTMHFIRNLVHDHVIEVLYCPIDNQVADIFTKSLTEAKILNFDLC